MKHVLLTLLLLRNDCFGVDVQANVNPDDVRNNLKTVDVKDGLQFNDRRTGNRASTYRLSDSPCSSSEWNRIVGDDSYADTAGDFCLLRVHRDNLLVDQSRLIVEFIDSDVKVPTIRRPAASGWGKTINADMLRRFFQIEVDENGEKLSDDDSLNRKLFVGGTIIDDDRNKTILEPLNVASINRAMLHRGKYPVVYVSFKNVFASTYGETEDRMRNVISDLYRRHGYLVRGSRNDDSLFNRYASNDNITIEELKDSLRFLSESLYRYFNRTKVILLLDDYDTPIHRLYMEVTDGLEWPAVRLDGRTQLEALLDLTGSLLVRSLRNADYLERGLIIGSSMNNLLYLNEADKRLSEFYGFTEQRTIELTKKILSKTLDSSDINVILDGERIVRWYCGYRFDDVRSFCNPASVTRSLSYVNGIDRKRPIFNYVDDTLVRTLENDLTSVWFQPTFQRIVLGANVSSILTNVVDFVNVEKEDRLVSMLTFYGLLCPVGTIEQYCLLRAGNEELKRFYEGRFDKLLQRRFSPDIRERTANFLLTGRTKLFEESFNRVVKTGLNNTRVLDGDNVMNFYAVIVRNLLTSSVSRAVITKDVYVSCSTDRKLTFKRILVVPTIDRYDTAVLVGINILPVTVTRRLNVTLVFKNDPYRKEEYDFERESPGVKNVSKVCLTFENYDVYVNC